MRLFPVLIDDSLTSTSIQIIFRHKEFIA